MTTAIEKVVTAPTAKTSFRRADSPGASMPKPHQQPMMIGASNPLNLLRIDNPEQIPASAKPMTLIHERFPDQAHRHPTTPKNSAAIKNASHGASDMAR